MDYEQVLACTYVTMSALKAFLLIPAYGFFFYFLIFVIQLYIYS